MLTKGKINTSRGLLIKPYFSSHTSDFVIRLLGGKAPGETLEVLADGAEKPGFYLIGVCFDSLLSIQQTIQRFCDHEPPINPEGLSAQASSSTAATRYSLHLAHPWSEQVATHHGKDASALTFELETLNASVKQLKPQPLTVGEKPRYTAEQTLAVAEAACAFARAHVTIGSTAIECNVLPADELAWRNDWVEKTRDFFTRYNPNPLESRVVAQAGQLEIHDARVAVLSRMQVGNCEELMIMALEFVLKNTTCPAESYCLAGGDHAFLVLNRQPGSNPCIPETWGDKAVFCDPWANRVYPAAEYADKLQSHSDVDDLNVLGHYQPERHRIERIDEQYNTRILHLECQSREQTVDHMALFLNYTRQLGHTANQLSFLQMDLMRHIRRLSERPEVVVALQDVEKALKPLADAMQSHQAEMMENFEMFSTRDGLPSYAQLKKILTTALKRWQQTVFAHIEAAAERNGTTWRALEGVLYVNNRSMMLHQSIRPVSARGMKSQRIAGSWGGLSVRAENGSFLLEEEGTAPRPLRQVCHDVFKEGGDCFTVGRDLNQNPVHLCRQAPSGSLHFFHRASPPLKPVPTLSGLLTEIYGEACSSSERADCSSPV